MSYNIRHIDNVHLEKKKYFFDANLWLKILKPQFDLSNRDRKYLSFFEGFKNHPEHPKIAVTSLLLSEVINRYLRDVSCRQFAKRQGNPAAANNPSFYKQRYRGTDEYQRDYISLCEDIKAFQNFYELFPDGLGTDIRQRDILNSPSKYLDFNDLFYCLLAKKHGWTIVTDDSDFFVENVDIITLNPALIDRANQALVLEKKAQQAQN